jgi:hypothetical protein
MARTVLLLGLSLGWGPGIVAFVATVLRFPVAFLL